MVFGRRKFFWAFSIHVVLLFMLVETLNLKYLDSSSLFFIL